KLASLNELLGGPIMSSSSQCHSQSQAIVGAGVGGSSKSFEESSGVGINHIPVSMTYSQGSQIPSPPMTKNNHYNKLVSLGHTSLTSCKHGWRSESEWCHSVFEDC